MLRIVVAKEAGTQIGAPLQDNARNAEQDVQNFRENCSCAAGLPSACSAQAVGPGDHLMTKTEVPRSNVVPTGVCLLRLDERPS